METLNRRQALVATGALAAGAFTASTAEAEDFSAKKTDNINNIVGEITKLVTSLKDIEHHNAQRQLIQRFEPYTDTDFEGIEIAEHITLAVGWSQMATVLDDLEAWLDGGDYSGNTRRDILRFIGRAV